MISIVICRIPWTNKDLNVYCAFGISLKASPGEPEMLGTTNIVAEWWRRRPAKPMGSPRVGSNPTGVDLLQCRNGRPGGVAQRAGLCYKGRGVLASDAARWRVPSSGAAKAFGVISLSLAQPPPLAATACALRQRFMLPPMVATAKGARAAPRHGVGAQNNSQKGESNTVHISHRSHFGSRYKLGCCGYASLFALS